MAKGIQPADLGFFSALASAGMRRVNWASPHRLSASTWR
jgi:hypothetical protein